MLLSFLLYRSSPVRDPVSFSARKKKPTWPNTLRHSITSAYSLTGRPAVARITLYLVVRTSSIFYRELIYLRLHKSPVLGVPTGEGERIAGIFGRLLVLMKTQGEIESAISEGSSGFEQE